MHEERIDAETGEILSPDDPGPRKLARIENDDRVPVPRQARDVAGVIAMLEEGQFNADVSEAMRKLVIAMEAHAHNNKGNAKGKVTVTLDLHLANGIFVITGSHAVKEPVLKRLGTALFAREDGGLGRNPSGQYTSIGTQADARDVMLEGNIRDV
jgi:hypothetical protein